MEPGSPELQVDSLPAEPPGKLRRSRYGPSIPVYYSLSPLRFRSGVLLLQQWVGIARIRRVGEVGWWCMWFLNWGLWVWLELEAWEMAGLRIWLFIVLDYLVAFLFFLNIQWRFSPFRLRYRIWERDDLSQGGFWPGKCAFGGRGLVTDAPPSNQGCGWLQH